MTHAATSVVSSGNHRLNRPKIPALGAYLDAVTPRPDHAEQVDDRQEHQSDEQGLLGPSGPLAVVVEAQRPGGDAVAELGRFPEADATSRR